MIVYLSTLVWRRCYTGPHYYLRVEVHVVDSRYGKTYEYRLCLRAARTDRAADYHIRTLEEGTNLQKITDLGAFVEQYTRWPLTFSTQLSQTPLAGM